MGGGISSSAKKEKQSPFRYGEPDKLKLPNSVEIGDGHTSICVAAHPNKRCVCFLLVTHLEEKKKEEKEQETEEEEKKEEQEKEEKKKKKKNNNTTPAFVQWTFYNDSKKDNVRVIVTFLGTSDGIQTVSPTTEMDHTSDGSLRVSAVVHAGETLPFVKGYVKAYLLKCEEVTE
ncbi:uncharacterized protein TM35_000141680 [Trypanosoma theileri]|uniref:DUF1935 domain-containing protein n=1 Tax=Trypanosoma theileri TaxID=67003 RepID=A0A1X0NW92_9TRYP|nr:uncharacterized protein TM35_000141680 [Trypanosoma theileri]ORC88957.1 hypothetical protein TM35_000141680 [Trypanosoma theileri]